MDRGPDRPFLSGENEFRKEQPIILAAQQLGYYHSKPEEFDVNRLQFHKDNNDGEVPPFPPLGHSEYLFSIFMELDFCESSFDGPIPLSWQTLQAYSQLCVKLSSNECLCLREMSKQYIKWAKEGADIFVVNPPWKSEENLND